MTALLIILGIIIFIIGIIITIFYITKNSPTNYFKSEQKRDVHNESHSEYQVSVLVEHALDDDKHKMIINNLILPGIQDKNSTTQIDTLVISEKVSL